MLMQFSVSLAAWFFVDNGTSQVTKLPQQKYCPGMPAVRISSSNTSFFNPANLLVLMSTTTSEIIQDSSSSDISGMGKMILPRKYEAYLPTLSLPYSSGHFCRTFQGAGVVHSVGFCLVGIGLSEEIGVVVFEEPGRAGQLALSLLAARSSGLAVKTSLAAFDIWLPLE